MNVLRFRSLWREATATPPPGDAIVGPWEGEWRSEPTGHRGRLRCVIRTVEVATNGATTIDAAFHAVFWKLFRATYEAGLDGRPRDRGYEIRGSRKLLFVGEYDYEGTIMPVRFEARYRSASDHGTFEMERPA